MTLSFTSFLSTLLFSSFIVFILVLLLDKIRINKIVSANIFMIFSIIFLIRLCLPVEFFFSLTIPSEYILPTIDHLLHTKLMRTSFIVINLKMLLIFFWIIGGIISLCKFIIKMYSLNLLKIQFRKYISSRYKKRDVAIVDFLISPVVIGLINPLIVVPNLAFTKKEENSILEHELFHINSFDLWIKTIYELLSIVYWWNPVILIFRRHFNQIIELKADEFVTRNLNQQEKVEYVEILLKVSKSVSTNTKIPQLNYLPSFSSQETCLLKNRVKNIFYDKKINHEKFIIIFSGLLGLYLSSFIIFEPYILQPEVEQESFELNEDNSYLIREGSDKFNVYFGENFLFKITEKERREEFKELEVYNSLSERSKK